MKPTLFVALVLLLPGAAVAQQSNKPGPARPPVPDPGRDTRAFVDRMLKDSRLGLSRLGILAPLPEVRVDLDVDNAPARDALKQLFDQAKQAFVVDEDVPSDKRVTVRVKGVDFATALNLVTQITGVGWSQQRSNGGVVYRISKGGRPPIVVLPDGQRAFSFDFDNLAQNVPWVYRRETTEQRRTFTCPHCKGEATIVRQSQAAKCPKCARVFQSDWQFCPADGSKRPTTSRSWSFCPLCGKPVAASTPEPGEINRAHVPLGESI